MKLLHFIGKTVSAEFVVLCRDDQAPSVAARYAADYQLVSLSTVAAETGNFNLLPTDRPLRAE